MIQAFHEIVSYDGDDWQEFLDKCLVIDIFTPVIKEYQDIQKLKSVIRYILYTYSQQSDKIILGMEWQKNKQQIFEFVQVKPEKGLYEDLVLLKNDAVLLTVQRWLDHQDGDSFKQLQTLKDLRVEMQLSSISKIIKSSGEVDYTQKFLNAEYANKLKVMIKDLESELIQNDSKLKDAVKEFSHENGKRKNSRNVGSYAVQ
jgi:hypothetical protein